MSTAQNFRKISSWLISNSTFTKGMVRPSSKNGVRAEASEKGSLKAFWNLKKKGEGEIFLVISAVEEFLSRVEVYTKFKRQFVSELTNWTRSSASENSHPSSYLDQIRGKAG